MTKKLQTPYILVGDVGGTKTILGLCRVTQRNNTIRSMQIFESKAYRGLEEIITEYLLLQKTTVSAACFGVGGLLSRQTFHGKCQRYPLQITST